jgi:hypothetical protein
VLAGLFAAISLQELWMGSGPFIPSVRRIGVFICKSGRDFWVRGRSGAEGREQVLAESNVVDWKVAAE